MTFADQDHASVRLGDADDERTNSHGAGPLMNGVTTMTRASSDSVNDAGDPLTAATIPLPEAIVQAPQALRPGMRLHDFRIEAVVGQGGFGIVYDAVDVVSGTRVAIKEYMPVQLAARAANGTVVALPGGASDAFAAGLQSFLNESRLLSQYQHPGLVRVLRAWEGNGTAYMAMPFYRGVTLNQVIESDPHRISEPWLKTMLAPLLDALAQLHRDGCVHRDVAPDNILITDHGGAVLLDLGAARRTIGDHVRALTVMLKPGFAPIEQYADDPAFAQGPWTDIYALAAVLFNAITGRAPAASATRLMRDNVAPLAGSKPGNYSVEFLAAIDAGLAVRPEARPRSIEAFRSLLFAPVGSMAIQRAIEGLADAIQVVGDEGANAAVDVTDVSSSVTISAGYNALATAGQRSGSTSILQQATSDSRGTRISVLVALIVTLACGFWISQSARDLPAAEPGAVLQALSPANPSAAAAHDVNRSIDAASAADPAGSSDGQPGAASAEATLGAATGNSAVANSAGTSSAGATSAGATSAGATSVGSHPDSGAAGSTANAATPAVDAAPSGAIQIAADPWAEVWIDGVHRGASPPTTRFTVPVGRHKIELRNPAAVSFTQTVNVARNGQVRLRHRFDAAADGAGAARERGTR